MTTLILFCFFTVVSVNSKVVTLDAENFESLTSTGKWYLEFFAPWCGHCKKFAPIYEEASEKLRNINFGAIDATIEKDLAKRFEVSRFPTIKFFENGMEYPYNGMRTIEGLSDYATDMLRPLAAPLTEESFVSARSRFSVSFIYVGDDVTDRTISTLNKDLSNFDKFATALREGRDVSKLGLTSSLSNSNANAANSANSADSAESAGTSTTSNADEANIEKSAPRTNINLFYAAAMRYRPHVKFFVSSRKNLESLLKTSETIGKDLKYDYNSIVASRSLIIAATPALNEAAVYTFATDGEEEENKILEFLEGNKHAPVIEMELSQYKELFDSTEYLGLAFVEFESDATKEFVGKMENIMKLKGEEWKQLTPVDEAELEKIKEIEENDPHATHYDLDVKRRRRMMFAVANYTKYQDWASGMFNVEQDHLPQMVILDTMQDGYYKDEAQSVSVEFIEKVFDEELEIVYVRNWFSRQGLKLERWLNSLSGWQIIALFVGIFVSLLGLMVLLDQCCAPPHIKTE